MIAAIQMLTMEELQEGLDIDSFLEDDRGSITLGAAALLYAKLRDEDLDELKQEAALYACDKYFAAREYLS